MYRWEDVLALADIQVNKVVERNRDLKFRVCEDNLPPAELETKTVDKYYFSFKARISVFGWRSFQREIQKVPEGVEEFRQEIEKTIKECCHD